MGFGQHSAEGARKRTRGPWAVGAGHMWRARGEGGGGACGPGRGRGRGRGGCGGCCEGGVGGGGGWMRCSGRRYYATLRCAAGLLLSATCDGARPWAAKGGSANDEASARPQVRRRATLLKPPIRPRRYRAQTGVHRGCTTGHARHSEHAPVSSSRCCCCCCCHIKPLRILLSPEMCRHRARILGLAGQPLHHAKQRVQCMCVYAHMSASIQVCLDASKCYAHKYIDQPPSRTAQRSAVPCRAKPKQPSAYVCVCVHGSMPRTPAASMSSLPSLVSDVFRLPRPLRAASGPPLSSDASTEARHQCTAPVTRHPSTRSLPPSLPPQPHPRL